MKTIKWAGNASFAATDDDATSLPITLKPNSVGVCIQVAWTGTTEGTVKAQASNDGEQWDDITSMTASAAGSAGQAMWLIDKAFFQFIQIVYTFADGDGELSGTYNEKVAQ